jgi:hypothetical protein
MRIAGRRKKLPKRGRNGGMQLFNAIPLKVGFGYRNGAGTQAMG